MLNLLIILVIISSIVALLGVAMLWYSFYTSTDTSRYITSKPENKKFVIDPYDDVS